jgi:hypothetical protein
MIRKDRGGNQMEEESKKIIREAINMTDSINDLMKAVIDEERKNIIYWQKSIKTWEALLNKKIDRYLKKITEEEVPF